jgi:hypothetical protein
VKNLGAAAWLTASKYFSFLNMVGVFAYAKDFSTHFVWQKVPNKVWSK